MVRTVGIATLGGICGALGIWLFQGHSLQISPVGMSYSDLAATMLGAAGVLLTALGLVIGALALWGYSQFRVMIETAAVEHVKNSVADGDLRQLVTSASVAFIDAELDQGRLRKILEDRLDLILLKGPSAREKEDASPDTVFEEGIEDDQPRMA